MFIFPIDSFSRFCFVSLIPLQTQQKWMIWSRTVPYPTNFPSQKIYICFWHFHWMSLNEIFTSRESFELASFAMRLCCLNHILHFYYYIWILYKNGASSYSIFLFKIRTHAHTRIINNLSNDNCNIETNSHPKTIVCLNCLNGVKAIERRTEKESNRQSPCIK